MELVEFGELSLREWINLTGRDREAFGATAAQLSWRPKERHVGLRAADGRLEAVAGATVVSIDIVGGASFDVVGVGGLIVRKGARGQGHMKPLLDRLAMLMESMGPEWAMIFCVDTLVPIYSGRGYEQVTSPVWVDQSSGRVEMPMPTMRRRLKPGAREWPDGRIDVRGLPF